MTSMRAGDSTNRAAGGVGTLAPVPWPRIVLPAAAESEAGADAGKSAGWPARGDDAGVVVVLSPDARAQTRAPNGDPLSPEQSRQVDQLRARDVEVRAHEAAHLAASGGLGGSPTFDYALGPDGKRYAVGGEVSVDTSPGRTPEETIARARTLRAAATAPADPSAQDMAVAASASHMEAQARSALQEQRTAESAEVDPDMTLLALTREQVSSRDGFSHNHQPNCGFCRRGASAYAAPR